MLAALQLRGLGCAYTRSMRRKVILNVYSSPGGFLKESQMKQKVCSDASDRHLCFCLFEGTHNKTVNTHMFCKQLLKEKVHTTTNETDKSHESKHTIRIFKVIDFQMASCNVHVHLPWWFPSKCSSDKYVYLHTAHCTSLAEGTLISIQQLYKSIVST